MGKGNISYFKDGKLDFGGHRFFIFGSNVPQPAEASLPYYFCIFASVYMSTKIEKIKRRIKLIIVSFIFTLYVIHFS